MNSTKEKQVEQSIDSRFYGGISIRLRLAVGFGVLILLMVLMAGLGAWRLAELDKVTTSMAKVNFRIERLVGHGSRRPSRMRCARSC